MYSKLEIIEIFASVKCAEDLKNICEAFAWLIDHEFEHRSVFLNYASLLAFKRITQ